jgi:hypothetical protein
MTVATTGAIVNPSPGSAPPCRPPTLRDSAAFVAGSCRGLFHSDPSRPRPRRHAARNEDGGSWQKESMARLSARLTHSAAGRACRPRRCHLFLFSPLELLPRLAATTLGWCLTILAPPRRTVDGECNGRTYQVVTAGAKPKKVALRSVWSRLFCLKIAHAARAGTSALAPRTQWRRAALPPAAVAAAGRMQEKERALSASAVHTPSVTA